jgi:hypothetical protein
MADWGALVLVFVLLAVGGPLLLYALVRAEHAREVMDRSAAERAARRDVDDDADRKRR